MTFFTWSQTAADNDDADSTVNVREGWAPSIVNNTVRALMAALAKWRDDQSGNLVTAGTSTAYTLTTNQTHTALTDGITVTARMDETNGAAATLNVDSLGAKAIASIYGTAMPTGALTAGGVYKFTFDSTDDKWIVNGRFADYFDATTAPDLNAIEALAATSGVLKKTAANTWALTAGIADLAATTANRLFGTDGSGVSGLITVSGLSVSGGVLTNDISGLTADTNPDATADFLLTYDASATAPKKTLIGYTPGTLIGLLEDRKAANTAPGNATASAWTDRALNTETYDRHGTISISSNQFTISAAGTYEIEWEAPFYSSSGYAKTRLYDVTGTAEVDIGTQGGWTGGTGATIFYSRGIARVTITASNTFSIQYYSSSTMAMGVASNSNSKNEVYTCVKIRRG